ncbi:MAG: hypothetical protein ACRDPI_10310 [Nocardioidaceae bacterium]
MRRRTFDALLTTGGLILAMVLVVGGGLLTWAHSFVSDQVTTQLSAQQIYFPPKGNDALASPQIKPYLEQYAGQQLTTGQQAQAYADHFIAVHIAEMTGGKTYAQLSAASLADPNNATLAAEVNTVFKGETLRGLLLNSYAFWKMGQIALYGAIAAFIGAGLMLVLSLLGLAHLRRVPDEQEVKVGLHHERAVTA